MLFQNSYAFWLILSSTPQLIFIGFYIAILIYAIFMYKKNSYKYGRFLMISSIMLIISNIYSFLWNYLEFTIGTIITGLLGYIFFSLEIIGFVFLFLSVFHIYKVHNKDRHEEKQTLEL
jgi:hypothetical protein